MKKRPLLCLVSVVFFATFVGFSATAQESGMVRYRSKPVGSIVTIDGTSNVHDWKMESTIIGGYLDIPANIALDSTQAALVGATDGKIKAKVEVRIPVASFNNIHKYAGMDNAMQEAMNEKDFKAITYRSTEIVLKQPHAAGTPLQFDSKGDLSFNGVTNSVTVPVSIETLDKNRLKIIAAAIPIKMTEYQVKPPIKMGLFITDPNVKISFEWVVGLAAKPAEAK